MEKNNSNNGAAILEKTIPVTEQPIENPAPQTVQPVATEQPKAEEPKFVVPEKYASDPTIKMLNSLPDGEMKDSALRNMVKLIQDNETKDLIIQKPNRMLALLESLRKPEGLVAKAILDEVKNAGLALSDLEDKFVHITFQDGKPVITADSKSSITKELRSSSGGRQGGSRPESMGFIQVERTVFKSAHALAHSFKLKYEGMSDSKAALIKAERYDSGCYIRTDGTPVLKVGGSLNNESDYIRTENTAKEQGIDLTGCVLAGKRHHPYGFKLEEHGTYTLDGTTKPLYLATKIERKLNPDFSIVQG